VRKVGWLFWDRKSQAFLAGGGDFYGEKCKNIGVGEIEFTEKVQ